MKKVINPWVELSIKYANQRSYLDDLFTVYPTIPEGIRDVNEGIWKDVEKAFKKRDNITLFTKLLEFDLFPIKDSYIAYLRKDKSALERNPATLERLCGRLYEMGLNEIYSRSTEPKETNRQIGPLFRQWLRKKSLGIDPVDSETFLKTKENAILDAGDTEMKHFAEKHFGYKHNKGLDFVARFNGKYVIGEAKFLTDFGGHQTAQFNDAIATIKSRGLKAVPVAILDGVLYIKSRNRMYTDITEKYRKENIMSALVLREFLYQL